MKPRLLRIDEEKARAMLERAGVAQNALAAHIGESPALVNSWLKGKSRIPEDSARKLCFFLDCRGPDILTDDALAFLRLQDADNQKAGIL